MDVGRIIVAVSNGETEGDLAFKELKVVISLDHHRKLRAVKLLTGRLIKETVCEALDLAFLTIKEGETEVVDDGAMSRRVEFFIEPASQIRQPVRRSRQTKELKVVVPVDYQLRLHAIKVTTGKAIGAFVSEALEAYFAKIARVEVGG